jgi:hypothetical protein
MLLNQLTASSEQQPVANGFGFWVLGFGQLDKFHAKSAE